MRYSLGYKVWQLASFSPFLHLILVMAECASQLIIIFVVYMFDSIDQLLIWFKIKMNQMHCVLAWFAFALVASP